MKKLAFDSSNWKLIGTINDLIDLVNSQQEAIEELEKQDLQERLNWTDKRMVEYSNLVLMLKSQIDALEPADDKPNNATTVQDGIPVMPKPVEYTMPANTHRTVTLRIPKGMTVGEIFEEIDNTYDWARWGGRWFEQLKDEEVKILFDEVTQKALDEVQPNE